MTEAHVTVVNELGLHLRAAARFVDVAGGFPCRVEVCTRGAPVDGKSLLALSSLLARRGAEITIRCTGEREEEACRALRALVASGFQDPEEP